MAGQSRGYRVAAGGVALAAVVLAGMYGAGRFATPPQPATQAIQIVASEFRFSPSEITLRAGVPTRLTFINEGKLEHDVVLEGLAAAQGRQRGTGSHGHDPAHTMTGMEGAVHTTAPSGQRSEVEFVPLSGTYRLICTITGHGEAGMHGTLRVG